MEFCPSCGEPAFFGVADVCYLTRDIEVDACCETNLAWWIEAIRLTDRSTRVDWMWRETGLAVRDVIADGTCLSWTIGHVRRGSIGVIARAITPELAQGLGIAESSGIVLEDVVPGSSAAKAGLKPGDVVVALDTQAVNVPTLLIWGDKDSFGPPSLAKEMAQSMAHGRAEVVLDAGHLAWLDQPDAVADLIADFLRS